MSKVENKAAAPQTDAERVEALEIAEMMIRPRDQRDAFLPDDDPKRLDGFRRPVTYWVDADQSIRKAFIKLPKGVSRHQDIHANPLMFKRIMEEPRLRLRVMDEVKLIAADYSWFVDCVVTHASDRVSLKPVGGLVELDWGKPAEQAKVAA